MLGTVSIEKLGSAESTHREEEFVIFCSDIRTWKENSEFVAYDVLPSVKCEVNPLKALISGSSNC